MDDLNDTRGYNSHYCFSFGSCSGMRVVSCWPSPQTSLTSSCVTVLMFLLQLFWNESGELLAISTDESYFILRYSPEAVEKARQNPENMTEDGVEDAFDVSLALISLPICRSWFCYLFRSRCWRI